MMRPFLIPLVALLLLPLASGTAAACTTIHGCVHDAKETVDVVLEEAGRAADEVAGMGEEALRELRDATECTTEAFGCLPPPARDIATCLVGMTPCHGLEQLLDALHRVACEAAGCR